MQPKKTITFIYAGGSGFSGQRFASELLMDGLRKKGWNILALPIPALDRVTEIKFRLWYLLIQGLKIGFKLLQTWIKCIKFSYKTEILHISMGQTKFSMIRDGFPILILNYLSIHKVIISMNGNNLMSWKFDDLEAKIMRSYSRKVKYITVVGINQKKQLSNLGIPEEKIILMDNTCLLPSLSYADILRKHDLQQQYKKQSIFILFLSSLIESKGYPEFVEAIYYLSNNSNISIEAVLCGPITIGREDGNQFLFHGAAKSWIEDKINKINQSSSVRLRWIDGAVGKQKEELFRQAHIFVLPSRYKVEAQPIVILEALASGCAVITTKVGEIPTTVSEDTALFLSECSPIAISDAIKELCENQNKRLQLAINGAKLFQERFSYEKHIERWEALLNNLVEL